MTRIGRGGSNPLGRITKALQMPGFLLFDGPASGEAAVFGFSELAEHRIGTLARGLGWRVQADRLALGNAEPYRRDITDPAHVWLADGRATLITVP